jgi:adenylylsulfate kinase-like enzyme
MSKNIYLNNKIATIWISGVTASGKTTLGKLLYEDLINSGIVNVKFLDGEVLRKMQNKIFGYSAEERFNAIINYIEIVKNENKKGNIVIISTVSHRMEMREFARDRLINFFEVNLLCSSETCAIRDYKNIYNRIDKNSNECLPGVTEPYEISDQADLILDTGQSSIKDSRKILLNKTLEFLNENIL